MSERQAAEAMEAAADRRRRRRLLGALHAARIGPRGGLHARQLKDMVTALMPPGERFKSDSHALALLRDLEGLGLVSLADERARRGQEFGIDYVFARITANGSALLAEALPPQPLVDDERHLED